MNDDRAVHVLVGRLNTGWIVGEMGNVPDGLGVG